MVRGFSSNSQPVDQLIINQILVGLHLRKKKLIIYFSKRDDVDVIESTNIVKKLQVCVKVIGRSLEPCVSLQVNTERRLVAPVVTQKVAS